MILMLQAEHHCDKCNGNCNITDVLPRTCYCGICHPETSPPGDLCDTCFSKKTYGMTPAELDNLPRDKLFAHLGMSA